MLVWSDRVFALVCAPRFIPFVIEGAARGGGSCRLPANLASRTSGGAPAFGSTMRSPSDFLADGAGPGAGGVGVAAGADGGGGAGGAAGLGSVV